MSSSGQVESKLQEKPNYFVFEKYQLNKKKCSISFFYRLEFNSPNKPYSKPIILITKINFNDREIVWSKINKTLLNNILFNLHLALGVDYYKTYCPKNIIIKSGILSKEMAIFWNKLYTKGLGEFFFKNKLDFRDLINFPYQKNQKNQSIKVKLSDRSLLPWGGGKDSCVSAEILKDLGHKFSLVSFGNSKNIVQQATARASQQRIIMVEKILDPQLLELNKQGVYNGHIPISAIYAWLSILMALLKDYRWIVYSNEASANVGNTVYLGQTINHQYSKSLEFENDLRYYLKTFVTPNINYFSLLRPYTEHKISEMFSHYPQYFSSFSSCNRNFSITNPSSQRWCGECPKCAFVFSQLAPFINRQKIIKIFGKNLLADKKLLSLYQELWGEKKFKPFECVGEPDEVKAALSLITSKKEWQKDSIVAYYHRNIVPKLKNSGNLIKRVNKISDKHNVPENFRRILILGYGQEGHFVAHYLKKRYPYLKFGLADAKDGSNYLEKIKDYEIIIKTPGISNHRPEIMAARQEGKTITSLTNIFLAQRAHNIIGVTGTKGKSTVASLITALLKAGKIKTQLVGNIGRDPLKHLNEIDSKLVFVYELSSYQLSLAPQFPHVAVFINIFPDHLPYHQGFDNYFQAKANIVKGQSDKDYFVYNSRYSRINDLARKNKAQKIDYLKKGLIKNGWLHYNQEKIIPLSEMKLLGQHNQENILAAIGVAKIYGVNNFNIRKALKKFTNLPHRLEFVGRYQGIDFYDDAISTTPESTLAAMEVFKNKIGTIILGGEDRGYNFTELANQLAVLKVKNIVLFPDSGVRIAEAIKKAYTKHKLNDPKILSTTRMTAAVKFAYQNTKKGQICLLSTASPSYSLFKNFEEKGNLFQKAVKDYNKKL